MNNSKRGRSFKHVEKYIKREQGRPAPYLHDNAIGKRPGGKRNPPYNRVFISNIPYDEKWQRIKDLFRDKVGEVTYVELILDEAGNSKGYGIVEFKSEDLALKAIEEMQGYKLNDRKLVLKEDFSGEILIRAMKREVKGNRYGERLGGNAFPSLMTMPGMPPPMPRRGSSNGRAQDHDQPRRSLDSINTIDHKVQKITGGAPFGNTIFVANLDYKVSYSKLKEVFKLAGNVVRINVHLDLDNRTRGMASITFETSFEAVQAISMFDKQLLYERPMLVKMDRDNNKATKQLPSGLQGIGPSLNLDGLSSGNGSLHGRSRLDRDSITELEMLTAKKKLLQSGLNENLGLLSGSSRSYLPSTSLSGIPGLLKATGSSQSSRDSFGMRLSALQHKSLSSRLPLRDIDLMDEGSDSTFDNLNYGRSLNARSQFMSRRSIPELEVNDRERIEMNIARVDSRIRDLDRSLKTAETRNSPRLVDDVCSVAIGNLPFSLSWQELKGIFGRVGEVIFAEIKKGRGLVRFSSPDEAVSAVRHFDCADLDGRQIRVKLNEDTLFRR